MYHVFFVAFNISRVSIKLSNKAFKRDIVKKYW